MTYRQYRIRRTFMISKTERMPPISSLPIVNRRNYIYRRPIYFLNDYSIVQRYRSAITQLLFNNKNYDNTFVEVLFIFIAIVLFTTTHSMVGAYSVQSVYIKTELLRYVRNI